MRESLLQHAKKKQTRDGQKIAFGPVIAPASRTKFSGLGVSSFEFSGFGYEFWDVRTFCSERTFLACAVVFIDLSGGIFGFQFFDDPILR